MKSICWLLAASVLIGAAPPMDAETRKDVRCFLAVSSFANDPDSKIAMSAIMGAQYYLGRIDGRAPKLDLEAVLIAETLAFRPADMPALLLSCGQTMTERGKAVTQIGKRLQEIGAKASSPSS